MHLLRDRSLTDNVPLKWCTHTHAHAHTQTHAHTHAQTHKHAHKYTHTLGTNTVHMHF